MSAFDPFKERDQRGALTVAHVVQQASWSTRPRGGRLSAVWRSISPVATSSFVIAALLNQVSFFAAYVPVALAVSVPMKSLP
ncbi:hypothetical protein [uncultured Sphingomonas sp.]|uniref:hypothetical protein n=1 Tax=uncultured Sphingomonas sp. TaxID=158754 RepID=UPI0025FA65AE|nr:hypothetical protein [uncultured Sphingomonas sp.]